MGAIQHLSSLSCELRIIRAKNVELIKPSSNTNLFVRYYLSAGNNRRIKLNTREISSKTNDPLWNESFSLECFGSEDSMQRLKQETVVFELRCRNMKPFLGKLFGGSRLLGRVEVPWKTVLESPAMEIEQWFTMAVSKRVTSHAFEGVQPHALQVCMKFRVPAATTMEMEKRRKNARLLKKWDECGCKDGGCKCVDDDIFALAALMVVF